MRTENLIPDGTGNRSTAGKKGLSWLWGPGGEVAEAAVEAEDKAAEKAERRGTLHRRRTSLRNTSQRYTVETLKEVILGPSSAAQGTKAAQRHSST